MVVVSWYLVVQQILKLYTTIILLLGLVGVIKNASVKVRETGMILTALILAILFVWF